MKRRYFIAVGTVLLAVVGVAIAQQPPASRPNPALTVPKAAPRVDLYLPSSGSVPVAPITEPKPEDLTIEQLLETVKSLRAQKAELEKQEQALMKVLTKKTNKVKEEIDNLNGGSLPVAPPAPPVPVPPTSTFNSTGAVPAIEVPTVPKGAQP